MKFAKTIAASILVLSTVPAAAADMATKALNNPFAQPYDMGRCGAYFGINSTVSSNAVTGDGTVPGQRVQQGAIGGTLGYGCPISAANGSFWFVEGLFDITNLNGASNGLALQGPASFTQRFGFGTPLNQLVGSILPTGTANPAVPSLPTLPNGVTAGPGAPYLFAALHEQDVSAQLGLAQNRQWLISPGIGAGLRYRLSNGVVADTFAEYRIQTNNICVGPAGNAGCAKIGSGVMAGVQFLY